MALRTIGAQPPPGGDRLGTALGDGVTLIIVTGGAADPRSAGQVTETVVEVVEGLQAASADAATEERGADIVLAVLTPNPAAPDGRAWRDALDEAVIGITQSLAREYVPDILRINTVLGAEADLEGVSDSVDFLSHEAGAFTVGAALEIRP